MKLLDLFRSKSSTPLTEDQQTQILSNKKQQDLIRKSQFSRARGVPRPVRRAMSHNRKEGTRRARKEANKIWRLAKKHGLKV